MSEQHPENGSPDPQGPQDNEGQVPPPPSQGGQVPPPPPPQQPGGQVPPPPPPQQPGGQVPPPPPPQQPGGQVPPPPPPQGYPGQQPGGQVPPPSQGNQAPPPPQQPGGQVPPPPPPGGQVPPQGGQMPPQGYTAPPQGGYGAGPGGPPPSAPPPGTPYGGGGGGYGGGYAPLPPEPQASDSFAWGWNAFKVHWGVLLAGQLLWAVIVIAVTLLWFALLGAAGAVGASGSQAAAGAMVGLGLGTIALLVLALVLAGVFAAAGMTNATLKVVRGEELTLADFFKIPNALNVLLLALIYAVAAAVLTFTIVGPLIMMFFGVYVVLFVIDQNMSVIDAIKHGIRMSMATPGQTVLLLVLVYVVNFIGSMLCGVGTLVSTPLSGLAIAWLYRAQLPMVPRR